MRRINVSKTLALAVAVTLLVCLVPLARASDELAGKPNVILIITDDQGYGDLSAHGNPWIKTPNLDQLASQSVRLDDFHVSPYCIPTRAALLTGRYADRTGIHNVLEPHSYVRPSEVLLSNMFQDAGYKTGMFGKWHLGDNYPYGPEHRGFDEVLRHYGGAVGGLADYWDNSYSDDTYYRNGKAIKVKGYSTDVFFSAAARFIDKSVEQNQPFFIYLATNAPHGPYIVPPSYSEPYAKSQTQDIANFYGMIANIDENIGTLRGHLRSRGLEENTILIFTGDNGTGIGHTVYTAGMRGSKGSPYDGGHRVPFFMYWPEGGLAEERRIKMLTSHMDIAPTLVDLSGIPRPDRVRFDGVSLRPLLAKGDYDSWPDRIIMTDAQSSRPPKKWRQTAVLTERWRLVGGTELYDIDVDPGQQRNISSEHPKIVERLSAYYDALWKEIEPNFKDVAEIPLGHPSARSVALTYHDSIDRHMFWFQDGIRNIKDKIDPPGSKRRPAFWSVDVVTGGAYTIELRRWPRELDSAIDADVPPGAGVYGYPAFRTEPGIGFPVVKAQLSIGEKHLTESVDENTKAVTFRVELQKGSQRLSGKFYDAKGGSLDAFYVYITKDD